MKIFKRYHEQFLKIFLPILLISFAICLVVPQVINALLFLNYIFLVPLLWLLCCPPKLKTEISLTSAVTFFLKISGLQFIIILISLFMHGVFLQLLPFPQNLDQILDGHSVNFIYHSTLKAELLHWGLFPWSLITLISLALMFFQKNYNYPITPLQCLQPLIEKRSHDIVPISIEHFLRIGLILAMILLMACIGLSGYYYLFKFIGSKFIGGTIPYGTTSLFLIIFIMLFPIFNSDIWKKYLRVFWKKYSSTQLLLMQNFLLIMAIVLLTCILLGLAKQAQIDLTTAFLFPLPKTDWLSNWKILNWLFWLGAVTYLAPIIAKIGAKTTPRIFIICNLFWPSVILLIMLFSPKYFLHLLSYTEEKNFIYIINLLCCVGLSIYFWKSVHFDRLLLNYFYRGNPKNQKKYPLKLFCNTSQLLALVLLLYLFTGIKIIMSLLFMFIGSIFVIYGTIALYAMCPSYFVHDPSLSKKD